MLLCLVYLTSASIFPFFVSDGPQVLEEPEVRQEAQRQSYPTVEARSQERSRQINPFPVFCFAMRYRHLCAVVYLHQNKMIVKKTQLSSF